MSVQLYVCVHLYACVCVQFIVVTIPIPSQCCLSMLAEDINPLVPRRQ